jgi:DNA-binding MarR family transcriptional regulator
MMNKDVSRLIKFYPLIYFACHTRHVTDEDTGVKLTANQASILDHLDMEQSISLYDLAAHMGVTPSTMSISVDRSVKLGYIKKTKNLTDARKTDLTLTVAGNKIKQSKSVLDPERVEAILNLLDPVERKQALDGLDLLTYAAEMEMKSKSQGKSWNDRKK